MGGRGRSRDGGREGGRRREEDRKGKGEHGQYQPVFTVAHNKSFSLNPAPSCLHLTAPHNPSQHLTSPHSTSQPLTALHSPTPVEGPLPGQQQIHHRSRVYDRQHSAVLPVQGNHRREGFTVETRLQSVTLKDTAEHRKASSLTLSAGPPAVIDMMAMTVFPVGSRTSSSVTPNPHWMSCGKGSRKGREEGEGHAIMITALQNALENCLSTQMNV